MKLSLRVRGAESAKELSEHTRHRALLSLGRFSSRIATVVVRLDDTNGPKGGIDKRCTIEIAGSFNRRLAVAEVRDQNYYAAIDRAFAVARRSIARIFKRAPYEFTTLH